MTEINTSNGAILEALNNKMDLDMANLPPEIDYVVSSGQSGDGLSWYRKYKSGWIEQGGTNTQTVLNFPLAFKDTTYTLTAVPIMIKGDAGSNDINYSGKTTTNIVLQIRFAGYAVNGTYMWYACGKGT